MLKHLFFTVVVGCGLAGCAEMAAPPAAVPDQSQAFKPSCSTAEPATGSMVRKKTCS